MRDFTGIYVHFPFCDVKCAYCDFFSIARRHVPSDFYTVYLENLKNEFRMKFRDIRPSARIGSVFIGGGTPSKVPPAVIAELTGFLRSEAGDRWHHPEVTLEANPESAADPAKLLDYRKAGVNRLSVGLQSRNPDTLRYLGRLHSVSAYENILPAAREAGFSRISCDFIYGVPGQTANSLRQDIESAIKEGVSHFSAYSLTVEEGTLLQAQIRSGQRPRPSARRSDVHIHVISELAQEAGFIRYEVSNFARPGSASRHNLGYWLGRDYVGIGVAAHSLISGQRTTGVRSLSRYSERDYGSTSPLQPVPDYLIGFLRITGWQSINRLQVSLEAQYEKFLEFIKSKPECFELRPRSWRLTPYGLRFSDSLLSQFYNSADSSEKVCHAQG